MKNINIIIYLAIFLGWGIECFSQTATITTTKRGYVTSTNWEFISSDMNVGHDHNIIVNDVTQRAFAWFDIPSAVQNGIITSATLSVEVKDISEWNDWLDYIMLYIVNRSWSNFYNSDFGYGWDDGHWGWLAGDYYQDNITKNSTKSFDISLNDLSGKNQVGFAFRASPEVPSDFWGKKTNEIVLNNPTLIITYTIPSLDVSPNSRTVSSSSGSTSFSVSTNVGWSVSDDASWLTATKTDGSTISVTYNTNTSTSSRTANITATGTGGLTETVTVTQSGESTYLDVSPNSRTVSSSSDSTTFTVTSNIDWSVSENSEWLSATKSNDTLLTIYYDENTSVDNRSANITLSGTGVSSQTVTVEQNGTISNAIIDLFDNTQITIYPIPSSNKIYLKPSSDINSEILISLYDGSGKLLYSSNVDKILSNETIEIDISAFNYGVYILRLNNSKSIKIKKVIKQ